MVGVLKKAWELLAGDNSRSDFKWLKAPKDRPFKALTERELLTLESEIGSRLFGELPKGRRRDFFCLDANTWFWHEEWIGPKRKLNSFTVRYEIQDQGILKVQEGARYNYLEGEELNNLLVSIQMYYERVMRELYSDDKQTD
ncbi:hypothetical protein CR956_00405 [Candidatus Saccharibacteria bacterium]|nr:MAG: hypothetical protein CR956_00405 [Candidatus Saccharibacteria bacterium]